MMKYVYILESLTNPAHFYTGATQNIEKRLELHNAGKVPSTAKFKPWTLKTYVAFTDETKAIAFEAYLKSGSGRAFAKKRL
jgi:predicted GIY-YIG superfamily endonuclease